MKYWATERGALAHADAIALRCLRDQLDPDDDVLLRMLQNLPSRYLTQWEGQGVLGLVAHRLGAADLLTELPASTRQPLVTVAQHYRDIADVYLEKRQQIIGGLTDQGIDVLVLKDPRGYPAPYTRPNYDLDLLIRRSQLDEVGSILRAQGYLEQNSPFREPMVDKIRGFDKDEHGLRVSLDVHWNLLGGYLPRASLIDVDELFDQAVTADDDPSVRVLSLPHHLVNVAMHCYQHECRWPSRLITFCDASEAIRGSETVDWQRVMELTTAWRAQADVHLVLQVARLVLGVAIPDDVLKAVRPDVQRLGIDAAVYGYLNYTWRYVDKLRAAGSPRAGGAAETAAGVLATAHAAEDALVEIGERLAETEGRPVLAIGGPSGGMAVCRRMGMFGEMVYLVEAEDSTAAARLLDELGMQRRGAVWQRPTGSDHVLQVRLLTGDYPYRGLRDKSIRWYSRKMLGIRRAPRALKAGILVIEPGALPATLLRQPGPLSLAALTQLAVHDDVNRTLSSPEHVSERRGRGIAELLGIAPPEAACGRRYKGWSLLDELDSRTNAIEALTKFVGSPSGFRFSESMAGHPVGVIGLITGIRRRDVRPADLRYVVRALVRANRERRVPPRVYLANGGDTILDYRGVSKSQSIAVKMLRLLRAKHDR